MASRTFIRKECDICGRVVASDEIEGWVRLDLQLGIRPLSEGHQGYKQYGADICSAPCFAGYAVRIRDTILGHPHAPPLVKASQPTTDDSDNDDNLPF